MDSVNETISKLERRPSFLAKLVRPARRWFKSSSSDTEKTKTYLDNPTAMLINFNDLKLSVQLGSGANGMVMKGDWTIPGSGRHHQVAVKMVKQDVLSLQGVHDNFIKEVNLMQQLNHCNLIRLVGVVLSPQLMMVTELAPLGSLKDGLRKECGHTPIRTLVKYAIQIASGMAYLEDKRMVHRDLAARNVLLDSKRQVKISNFGLMRALADHEDYYTVDHDEIVPFHWCAPESLRTRHFSSASDTWMFGVTLWEMFTFGQEPWLGLNGAETLQKIDGENERLHGPNACPPSIYQLMLLTWHRSPSNRPTFVALTVELEKHLPLTFSATSKFESTLYSQQPGLSPGTLMTPSLASYRWYLNIEAGDKVQIIDGRPQHYLCKVQSQRTFEIGYMPRCLLKMDTKCIKVDHISLPSTLPQLTNRMRRSLADSGIETDMMATNPLEWSSRVDINHTDGREWECEWPNKPNANTRKPRDGLLIDLSDHIEQSSNEPSSRLPEQPNIIAMSNLSTWPSVDQVNDPYSCSISSATQDYDEYLKANGPQIPCPVLILSERDSGYCQPSEHCSTISDEDDYSEFDDDEWISVE